MKVFNVYIDPAISRMVKKGHLVVSHSFGLLGLIYKMATLNNDFSFFGKICFEQTKKLKELFRTSRSIFVHVYKKFKSRGVYIMEVEFWRDSLICEFCFSGDNGLMRNISVYFKSDLTQK